MLTRKSTCSTRPRPRAFTLVELLVVLSIVAGLIALLMPAISKAKKEARVVKCAANFRQMAVAYSAYTMDFNGWLTGYIRTGYTNGAMWLTHAGTDYITTHGVLIPYLGNPSVYFTPDGEYPYASYPNLNIPEEAVKQFKTYKPAGDNVIQNVSIVTSMQMPLIQRSGTAEVLPPGIAGDIRRVVRAKPSYPAISPFLEDNVRPKMLPILLDAQLWRDAFITANTYGGAHEGRFSHVLYADMSSLKVAYDYKAGLAAGLTYTQWHMGGSTAGSLLYPAEWNTYFNAKN